MGVLRRAALQIGRFLSTSEHSDTPPATVQKGAVPGDGTMKQSRPVETGAFQRVQREPFHYPTGTTNGLETRALSWSNSG